MDDPLIGLTIYDTTKSTGAEPPVAAGGSGNTKVQVDDVSEKCFSCLPGISEEQHQNKVKFVSKSSVQDGITTTNHNLTETDNAESELDCQVISQPKNFWLLRLFESNLFDMSIAIGYLFNSKDHDVQSYLGSKLFVS